MSTEKVKIDSFTRQLRKDNTDVERFFKKRQPAAFFKEVNLWLLDGNNREELEGLLKAIVLSMSRKKIPETLEKSIKEILAKEESDTLCRFLYKFATIEANKNFPSDIYTDLSDRVKFGVSDIYADLPEHQKFKLLNEVASQKFIEELNNLDKSADEIFKTFKYKLELYCHNTGLNIGKKAIPDKGKDNNPDKAKSQEKANRLEAIIKEIYEALKNYYQHNIINLYQVLLNYQNALPSEFFVRIKSLFSGDSLSDIIKKFTESFNLLLKTEVVSIYRQSLLSHANMAAALLNDAAFGMLQLERKNLLEFAKKHPNYFFKIMIAYRPHVVNEMLADQRDDISKDFTALHEKYLEGHFMRQPVQLTPIRRTKNTNNLKGDDSLDQNRKGKRILYEKWLLKEEGHLASIEFDGTEEKEENPTDRRPISRPKLTESTSSLVRHPARKQRLRYHFSENVHELLEPDINVGLNQLRQRASEKKICLFSLSGDLSSDKETSIFDSINTATHKNAQTICFFIMNINQNHWISLYTYQPTTGRPQLIFINGVNCDEKEKLDSIRSWQKRLRDKLGVVWDVQGLNITQQAGGQTCGISCLQNAEDLIEKNVIYIEKDRMQFVPQALTLCWEHYKGTQEGFIELIEKHRIQWEAILEKIERNILYDVYGKETDGGPYSFTFNRSFQIQKDICKYLYPIIKRKFIGNISRTLQQLVSADFEEGKFLEVIDQIVKKYFRDNEEANDFEKSYSILNKLQDEYKAKFQGSTLDVEKVDFSLEDLEEFLKVQIKEDYRKKKCSNFKADFIGYLKSENIYQEVRKNPNLLAEHYNSYQESSAKWIRFFNLEQHLFVQIESYFKDFVTNSHPREFFFTSKAPESHHALAPKPQPYNDDPSTKQRRSIRLSTNTISVPEQTPSGLQESLVDTLVALKAALEKYKQQKANKSEPFLSPLKIKPDKKQVELNDAISKLDDWIEWFGDVRDNDSVQKQRYYIANNYFLVKIANMGADVWDEATSYAPSIIGLLAKFVGVPNKVIETYNTSAEKTWSNASEKSETGKGYQFLYQKVVAMLIKMNYEYPVQRAIDQCDHRALTRAL